MTNLIQELRKEHVALLNLIKEVKRLGITSKEGLKLLHDTKKALLMHLTKEDQQLYTVLKEAAKTDIKLRHLLMDLAVDMEAITKLALEFFDKYTVDEHRFSGRFTLDVAKLLVKLKNRIIEEEHTLYVEYDKIVNPMGKLATA